MPRGLRLARGPGAAPAATAGGALRRQPAVVPGERHRRQPRRARHPSHRGPVRGGHGGRVAARAQAVRAVEPARARRGHRPATQRAHRGGRSRGPARRRRHAHDRVHPIAARRRTARRVRAARGGRRRRNGRRITSYRAGYLAEDRRRIEQALAVRGAARGRLHERAGAGDRHRLARRGGAHRLPGHARLVVAAGRARGAARAATRSRSWWPRTIPSTSTSCTTPRTCSTSRPRRP